MIVNQISIRNLFNKQLIPQTRKTILLGGHVFGGAVLRVKTNNIANGFEFVNSPVYDVLATGTNERYKGGLYHGEICTLQNYFNKKKNQPPVLKDESVIFVATHQPCLMCTYALTWIPEITNIFYVFDYKETQEMFGMGTDIHQIDQLSSVNIHFDTSTYYILGESNKYRIFSKIVFGDTYKEVLTSNYAKLYNLVDQLEKENNTTELFANRRKPQDVRCVEPGHACEYYWKEC